jgi:hypothetical protein
MQSCKAVKQTNDAKSNYINKNIQKEIKKNVSIIKSNYKIKKIIN